MSDDELRGAFMLFDANGDGKISEAELEKALQSLGKNVSKKEVKEMMEKVDTDKSGSIEFNEFATLFRENLGESGDYNEEDLMDAFKTFDDDGSGQISVDELKKALMSFGEKLSEEEAKLMVEMVDIDGNGMVSYSEFVQLMKSK